MAKLIQLGAMQFELNIKIIRFAHELMRGRYTLKVDTPVSKVRSSSKNCNQLLSTRALAQNCAIVEFNTGRRGKKNKGARYEIRSSEE